MRGASRRSRGSVDFWPGFVDALSTMLIVILFLVLVFVLAQFFLVQAIAGRDAALDRLKGELAQLADTLALQKVADAELKEQVGQLSAEHDRAEHLQTELGTLVTKHQQDEKSIAQRDIRLSELLALRELGQGELAHEKELSSAAQRQVELLNLQIAELRKQLSDIQSALDIQLGKNKEADAQIADLGQRLNAALASKVAELARYRSEFFGRLRQVLGNRQDIQIVGDRFVFQSEVLFDPGSAVLGPRGRDQIKALANTLKELTPKIPADLKWILRVDGHTDPLPIHNSQFASNWELSTARAIAVVKFLIAQGIAPEHLTAAGFGEFQPLVANTDDASRKRNRRIELKLTER